MPFVIVNGERFELEHGENVLGGHDNRALVAEAIAHLPAFARIDYPREGPSTIAALGEKPVTLNGAELGAEPELLEPLDRIEIDGLVLVYGEPRRRGRGPRPLGDTQKTKLVPIDHPHGEPTASTGGRLTRLSDNSVHPVRDAGLTIGRDPSSDIVLASKNVSRAHVTISASLLGYTLSDHSYRGVWVNDVRVEGSCVLGQRDIIRVDDVEFRFEADAASFEPGFEVEEDASMAANRRGGGLAYMPTLASIEVVSDGPLKGQRFRISRPTVQIGRSQYNDVRLGDETVSSRHASLVRRGNNWMIFDVGSRNGTFVEGQIVRDHSVLPSACELRLGTLKLLFRAVNTEPETLRKPGTISAAAANLKARAEAPMKPRR